MGSVMGKQIPAPGIQDGGSQVNEWHEDGLLKVSNDLSRAGASAQHRGGDGSSGVRFTKVVFIFNIFSWFMEFFFKEKN